jgi:hypothetical protein
VGVNARGVSAPTLRRAPKSFSLEMDSEPLSASR